MTTSKISLASQIAAAQIKSAANGEERPSESQRASFSEILAESIEKVNHLQKEADEAIQGLSTGAHPDIAQTMVAVEKASLSFQLMTQMRNKLVRAYEEVMRTPEF